MNTTGKQVLPQTVLGKPHAVSPQLGGYACNRNSDQRQKKPVLTFLCKALRKKQASKEAGV